MKRFATALLALVIIASQINSHSHFINASLTAYYLYVIAVAGFTACCAVWMLKRPVGESRAYSWPLFLYALFTAYIIINSFLFASFTYKTAYALAGFLFTIGVSIFINRVNHLHLKWIFIIINALAVLQGGICLLQWFKLIPSTNRLFAVTGSWVNPNVTAMFLALSIPSLLNALYERRGRIQGLLAAGLLVVISALLMLKCRTAFIGAGVAAIILTAWKCEIASRFKTYTILKRCILLASTLLLLTLAGIGMCNSKKASTECRKLVWRLSSNMIAEKPVTGYGYGQFEKNYNLFQAAYLAEQINNKQLPEGAGYVNMAYNELLEITVECGLPALLLVICLGGCLLLFPLFARKKNSLGAPQGESKAPEQALYQVTYAGIVAFIIMSLVNFTFQAIPVYCTFLCYFVILAKHPVYNIKHAVQLPTRWKQTLPRLAGILLIAGNACLMLHWYKEAMAHVQLKKAVIQAKRGSLENATKRIRSLHTTLNNAEGFWRNYAYLLLVSHKYQQASKVLEKASELSADPDIYYAMGYCHEQTGAYSQAVQAYQLAAYLEPQRIKPRYALMKLYYRSHDTLRLAAVANQIIALPSKGNITEANRYKSEANKLLQKINNQSPTDKVF